MQNSNIKITECPRDAMQGIQTFIPTEEKARYINALLKVGFDTIDFGSFVSPKAIPQMRDTAEVLGLLEVQHAASRLLAITGNLRGAETAAAYREITYVGFPFSISPTFLQRNIKASLEESFERVQQILALCKAHHKHLVTYISMAFGNPYGDDWNIEVLMHWIEQLQQAGVRRISLADTYGLAHPDTIGTVIATTIPAYADIHFSLHLHTTAELWYQKIDAAYKHGCRHFEGVLSGLGGCPMAGPKLVGNLRTADLVSYFRQHNINTHLDLEALRKAEKVAAQIISG